MAPRLALGTACLLAVLAATVSRAGQDANAVAWLSWSPTAQVNDTPAAAVNNLYVRVTNLAQFKEGEIDLTWEPAGDGAGCFDNIGIIYKTSSGTTCTYLNRGSAVPVITVDDPDHLHLAWANNSCLTSCTAGAIILVQFETDRCADPTGCFRLNYCAVGDCVAGPFDVLYIANTVVTVGGGGTHHCDVTTPALPSTWGRIKATYARR